MPSHLPSTAAAQHGATAAADVRDLGWPSHAPDPRVILCSIGEVVYDWDLATDRLRWGPNLGDVLGVADAGLVATGLAYAKHLVPESPSSRFEAVLKSPKHDGGAGVAYQVQYGLVIEQKSGGDRRLWIEDTGRWFSSHDGLPAQAHGVVRVITERHEAERQRAAAEHLDPLTGTLGRAAAVEHLARLLAKATRQPSCCFSVLLMAIDDLHWTNRNFGYEVGDELIAGIARRLASQMRSSDVLARYSGHKLLLILDGCDGDQMVCAAQRFLTATGAAEFPTAAGLLPATLKIGGVTAPRHARTTQLLFQRAEEALDAARARAALRFAAYEPSLLNDDTRIRTQTMAQQILGALNQHRIEIALEPVVHATSRTPFLFEALMRMRREDGSLVAPTAIFPVAEKVGLVQLLDHRVLDLALARLTADPGLHLAVNMSTSTVHDADWPARAQATFALHPGTAERLTVEITETCAIEDLEATQRVIAAMKRLGVKVAMDDFGAGHTSFRNLRSLAFDLLKIDGAFVQNLARSADDRFFVRTLVDLAHHLEIPVVAEWVEDAETAELLASWQVDYLQGKFFDPGTGPRADGELGSSGKAA